MIRVTPDAASYRGPRSPRDRSCRCLPGPLRESVPVSPFPELLDRANCRLTHKSATWAKICVKRAKLARIWVKFPLDFRFILALGCALRRTANMFRRPQAYD